MGYRKILVSAIISSVALFGCTNQGGPFSKQTVGAVLGGVGGGVVGTQIGKGTGKTAAVIAGTLAGAALGSSIGASLDKADQMHMLNTQQKALEVAPSGQTVQWNNPDKGTGGSVTPIKTYQTTTGQYCREYTQTVTIGGKTQQAYGTACRQPDGSWYVQQ